jgi:hypothetical protein
MRISKQAQENAVAQLRGLVRPGDTVYTVLRHVSRSGMSRSIDLYAVIDGEMRWLTGYAAQALETAIDKKNGGLKISGCGMDMGFALVYDLSSTLWPKGFECIGDGCRSNDHFNGDRNYSPHSHRDGGYALRQSWL